MGFKKSKILIIMILAMPALANASWIRDRFCGPLLSIALGLSSPAQILSLHSIPAQSSSLEVGIARSFSVNAKDSWDFANNPGVVPASVVIMRNEHGKFLMAKRKGSTGAGTFASVGGKVDQYLSDVGVPLGFGDDFYGAAKREAKEEIGIDLENHNLKLITSVRFIHPENQKIYVVVVFEAIEWKGRPSIQEPEKMTDLAWYGIEEVRDNLYPASLMYLQDVEDYYKIKDDIDNFTKVISNLSRYQ